MFIQDDNTYNEIRQRSVNQWLEEMEGHEDVAVRGGVRVTRDYIDHLQKQIDILKEKNQMKDEYLKKLKDKN